MSFRLFDRPFPVLTKLIGNWAVAILMVVFFMVPFGMRGARESVQRLENNIKDWLPDDFPETKDLEWFGDHFVGERFILFTWPGCHEADQSFDAMVGKLETELAPNLSPDDGTPLTKDESVRRIGDKLGLFKTGKYYENWGARGEKWLLGDQGIWYFITPEGDLYKWDGDADMGSAIVRGVQRLLGRYEADGEVVATVGSSLSGQTSPYHKDPQKLTARLFHSFRTGPQVLEELTKENGAFWPRGDVSEEDKPRFARQAAYKRLTGALFGPAVKSGFSWEVDDFRQQLSPETLEQFPSNWEERFTTFVDRLVEKQYGGDRDKLLQASAYQQTLHWDEFFARKLRVDPPPRQSCIMLTMSEAGKRDLGHVMGRPILGQPPGKLLDLAYNECGIAAEDFKMGGPPVDNVAIDEEGTRTLVKLVGYSAIVGLTLSLLCFRSVTVTIMVFFVGGVSAVASLAVVFWSSAIPGFAHLSTLDAVLMSMPSLVYVLGLSGAVHIVNYYREAVAEQGVGGAPERALAHGWFPCTLAAFTTALGLVSLYSSNLLPIKKFGLFSAVGVMMTLMLLFFYLPSALTIWPFVERKREESAFSLAKLIERMWLAVGRWVIRRHWLVTATCMVVLIGVGLGLQKIKTSVQLLELFDPSAKIIGDYRWLEDNLGKLVPMELVVKVKPEIIRPTIAELRDLKAEDPAAYEQTSRESTFQLSVLERMELIDRIQTVCEEVFGEEGQDIIGKSMSAVTYVADLPPPDEGTLRGAFNDQLEERLSELPSDYVRTDTEDELWRISERLGAFNRRDYGVFVHEQKLAVEPVLAAYRNRNTIFRGLDRFAEENGRRVGKRVTFFGLPTPPEEGETATNSNDADGDSDAGSDIAGNRPVSHDIDQTKIFVTTLTNSLRAANFYEPRRHHPDEKPIAEFPDWGAAIHSLDCVVLVVDHPDYDVEFLKANAKVFVDARDHIFKLGESKTAVERGDPIQVVYTGVVPVVYKAQRTLLTSLIKSIGWAFAMIACVMMILLRDWKRRPSLTNTINLPAGMISMIPNVFPVVLIFGAMGYMSYWGVAVDIGTMMCASVAMGVAVDDTIHYLTWFRIGMRQGLSRNEAILEAYRRVATAMTQTTLIGGLGLAVFAASTFTPTQRFGVMMVTLLAAALVGDLILLPAILAGPLGRFFALGEAKTAAEQTAPKKKEVEPTDTPSDGAARGETRHSATVRKGDTTVRSDRGHQWPRH
jgi:predicted RND superfamily exporter protein